MVCFYVVPVQNYIISFCRDRIDVFIPRYMFVELTRIVLRIPQSRRESKDKGWTIDDIERLTRLGNLRVQQLSPQSSVPADSRYYMGSSPYYMKQFWLYEHRDTFWKHDENPYSHSHSYTIT